MKLRLHYLGVVLFALAAVFGCSVGPNYKRPPVNVPATYHRAASDERHDTGTNSFADLGWWQVYEDPQLRHYIAVALTNNYDIKIAAARVLQAEASARIVRSQYFPQVDVGGNITSTRISPNSGSFPSFINPKFTAGEVFVASPAYEVDLWGRLRRANEAARAQLLATEESQRTVRETLVADVATIYLQLLTLDRDLQIGRESYVSRTNSLALNISREQGGVAGLQDVYQAQILVGAAEGTIVDTLRQIEQTENALNILLGQNPGCPIKRGIPLRQQPLRASVPTGLPSSLLERRPDIRAAEQNMVAANANIGEARAAYFPKLTLTGLYGYQSISLGSLMDTPSRMWQFGPTVTIPVFTGGRLKAQLDLARARFEESVASYRQTVQQAFREVSDALIAYQRTQEFYAKQFEQTEANRNATDIAHVRYEGGVTSYLEVIYNEQQLLDAELLLSRAQLNELLSVVQLYQALGGGWTTPYGPTAHR